MRMTDQVKAIYRAVVEDLDSRIELLQTVRATVAFLAGVEEPIAAIAALRQALDPPRGRRADKRTATERLIVEVIGEGHTTTAAIRKAAKLSIGATKRAITQLLSDGRITRQGATSSLRYGLPGKAKR